MFAVRPLPCQPEGLLDRRACGRLQLLHWNAVLPDGTPWEEDYQLPYLRIRDTDLYYREHGSGPLAVFLHAYLTDHTMWLDQLRELGNLRRCVAIDMRGFGRSDPIVPSFLDYELYADDVADVVEALGEEKADIIGFSAGGTIAVTLWKRHPKVVRSLVLMTPGVGGSARTLPDGVSSAPGERGSPDYLDANARRAVFEGKAVLFDRFQVAGYHFGPKASLTAKARYRSMFEGTRTDMMVATFQTLARGADLVDVLPTISVPVLFVRGEDESMPTEALRDIAGRVPGARIAMVPASGRFVMIENPEATTSAVREFWQHQPAAAAVSTRQGGTGS